jgi:4-hydroxybenzoyl-CoA thioesterase
MHRSEIEVRVEFGNCDPTHLIYYPNYFVWFDRAAWHFFESAGFGFDALAAEHGIAGLPLVDTRARFAAPVRWGDDLVIETRLERWGTKSFDISHMVRRDGNLCVEGREIRVMAGTATEGPGPLAGVPVPKSIRDAIGEPLEQVGAN